ncbi:EpsG family protein [Phocaeicola sp.]
MFFYILIWAYLLICSLTCQRKNILWGNILVLSVIAGLRAVTVGVDTKNYLRIFEWIADGGGEFIEPGWFYLCKMVLSFGMEYNMLLWIVSVMTLIPVAFVVSQKSPNPSLSIFFYYSLYFYLNSFNIMRQILSVSFVFLGYIYLEQGRKKAYVFWVCIATLFHLSALSALGLLWIDKIKLTSAKIILLLCLSFLLGSLVINDMLLAYIIGDYANATKGLRESLGGVYVLGLLVNSFFLIIYFTTYKNKRNSFWMKIFFIGLVCMNLVMRMELSGRIILYFTISQIILLVQYVYVLCRIREKKYMFLLVLVYVMSIFMKILILANIPGRSVIPYESII